MEDLAPRPAGIGGVGLNLTSVNAGLEIGSVVAGKFRIERILAEGGMGLVAAATHLQLDQTVALKFFRGDVVTTGESRLRFMREAKAAAQLKSEYVARVLDVGVTEGGAPYIVMEYLEGLGLERVIANETALDPASACEYAIQACEALSEAHARGIIHRDIKPSNLFLAERAPGWRAIKVLDFGVSKMSLAQASNITTNLNVVMGTPCYMSPEQIQSAAGVDHRTDIWSLGATLYEMLTGLPPFDPGLPILALAEEIAGKEIPSVHTLRSDVPEDLSDVVARCLLRDREQRIASAADLAAALVPFAPSRAQLVAERAATLASALGAGGRLPRTITPSANTPAPAGPAGNLEVEVDIEVELDAESPGASALASTAAPEGAGAGATPSLAFASPTTPPRPIVWSELDGDGEGELSARSALASTSVSTPAYAVTTGILPADRDSLGMEGWLSPKGLAVLAAGSILLCVFAFLILPRLVHHQAPAAARPRPFAGALTTVSTSPEAASGAGSSELVIYVAPASAQIVIDGRLVGGSPFHGQFPRGGTHLIKAIAPGYQTRVEQARMYSDVVINLSLDRSQTGFGRRPSRHWAPARVAAAEVAIAPRVADSGGLREPTPTGSRVDPRGGRAPLHPIVTISPYDAQ
jgi:eukaryotic-like serine/threonine-protein kinase